MARQSVGHPLTERKPVAPVWHTLVLLLLLPALSSSAVYLRMASANARLHHLPLYAFVIVGEWTTFAFCLWRSDPAFVAIVGRVVHEPCALGWDLLTAVVLAAVLLLIAPLIIRALGPAGFASTRGLLPTNGVEVAVWMLMAMSAGVCEETVFRGYLQQQFTAWTGYAAVAIVLQAIIFGAAHAYQGWKNVTLIAVWALVFGVAAWLRRGLRGNMIAHAAIDALAVFSSR
jgi:uncharacterized protein